MGVIVRQSFWNSIWSYLGIALGYINLVILFPKFLSTDEFGLTRIFIAASMIVAQFGALGLINISVKYFPYFKSKDDNHHNGFLFFGFIITTIGSLACVLGLIVFKPYIISTYIERSKLFVDYYYWLFPISIALIYFHQYSVYARVILKSSLQTFAREFLIRLLHLLAVLLYAFGFVDFDTFVALFVLSYFFNGLFLVIYLAFDKALNYIPSWGFYKNLPLKEIAQYGAFVILSNLGGYVAGNVDVLMLGAMAENGLTDVAIYSVAFYIGNVVNVPIKAVYSIALPIVADAWKNNDLKKIHNIYKKSSINQLAIGSLILLGLYANLDNMFSILPSEYASGRMVVLIIAGSQLFNIASGINGGIIVNSPYYKYDTLFIVLMIIGNIILNIVFIKMLGFVGAAVATAVTLILFNVGRIITVKVKSKMQPFSVQTIYVLIISAVIYGIQMLLPKLDIMLVDLIVRSALIVLLFVPAIYFFNISEDINQIIRKSLKTVSKLIGNK